MSVPGPIVLESPLPGALPAERGTALFCSGSAPAGVRFALEVDGVVHTVDATDMPRPRPAARPRRVVDDRPRRCARADRAPSR